ncbi:winged helix-turn-helix transcriptional regulator [Gulosibacter chungangensis]|uniref:Response regulator n=1 Tax=Gulosibacter chungangensis TaxID=979746 RepID=A0A7J5B7L8_9MICO|nr:response regulator transcription factor [Gulosibacter chungangensis]KAB1640997.1 response regulator [Gulosibacter chungangensis]
MVVVIIEDDPDVGVLLDDVFRSAGFETIRTTSGLEGVAAVREYDPIITTVDINLPDIDGFEVSRRIRKVSESFIVMISALSDETDVVLGLTSGADEYLIKPFRPRELRARIEALMRRSRTLTGAAPNVSAAPTLRVVSDAYPDQASRVASGAHPAESRRLTSASTHLPDAPATETSHLATGARAMDASSSASDAPAAQPSRFVSDAQVAQSQRFGPDTPATQAPSAAPVSQVSAPATPTGTRRANRARVARHEAINSDVYPVIPARNPTATLSIPVIDQQAGHWQSHRDVSLNLETHTVLVAQQEIDLTPTEFDLLATLLESKRRVRSKADLALVVRGDAFGSESFYVGESDKRAIEAHMANLRRKLGDSPSEPRYIETVRGVGYRLTRQTPHD